MHANTTSLMTKSATFADFADEKTLHLNASTRGSGASTAVSSNGITPLATMAVQTPATPDDAGYDSGDDVSTSVLRAGSSNGDASSSGRRRRRGIGTFAAWFQRFSLRKNSDRGGAHPWLMKPSVSLCEYSTPS